MLLRWQKQAVFLFLCLIRRCMAEILTIKPNYDCHKYKIPVIAFWQIFTIYIGDLMDLRCLIPLVFKCSNRKLKENPPLYSQMRK